MSILRKCIVVSLLLLSSQLNIQACGYDDWQVNMGNVFALFDQSQLGYTFTKRVHSHWVDYVGHPFNATEVEDLGRIDVENLQASDNVIVKTALQRNDQETLPYLIHLHSYLMVCRDIQNESWDYPNEQELQNRKQLLNMLNREARAYSGKRYQAQYALLEMRTLLVQKKYDDMIELWKGKIEKMKSSVFRDMARGMYAGALLHTGHRAEACRMYAELGDMQSIRWIMREQTNLAGIKREFNADPTSPTLIYLVQDFVENMESSLWFNYYIDASGKPTLGEETNKQLVSQFISFAQQVVASGKSDVPAMWQSASGYLNYALGHYDLAITQLQQAMGMKGTQRMTDNARVCLLQAKIRAAKHYDKAFLDNVQQELKWLNNVAQAESRLSGEQSQYYTAISLIVCENLVDKLQGWGKTPVAINTIHMANNFFTYVAKKGEFPSGEITLQLFCPRDVETMIDKLTSTQLEAYWNYMCNNGPANGYEKWVASFATKKMSNHQFNDLMGTKCIREGKWSKAIGHLELVPMSYLRAQSIAPYMAARNFAVERWFKRQPVQEGNYRESDLKFNPKLRFCQNVLLLQQENTAEAKYALASLLYQASFKGDCWYLARYGWSYYDEIAYQDEFHFVDEAIALLKEARATAGTRLKEKCLYALAYIPYEPHWFDTDYDKNGNTVYKLNRNSEKFMALQELNNFYLQHSGHASPFLSRCDVLKDFQMLTKKSGRCARSAAKARHSRRR